MSEVKVDTISERTAANGVAVDGVTIKDSGFTIPSGGTLTVASGGTITNSGTATGFGGDNTPAFSVTIAASQTFATGTWTKVQWDTEVWDTDSAFDSTTNYRFTVPAGEGGKYVFHYGMGFDNIDDSENIQMRLYKNGGGLTRGQFRIFSPASQKPLFGTGSTALELIATDYVEAWCEQGEGATIAIEVGYSFFSGFKLVGV